MEDRYLYKAKRIDNGEWEIGSLIAFPTGEYNISNKCNNPPDCDPMWDKVVITHKVDPSTICQCTGLKDKNDKLIWENDVVNCMDAECCGYISWNESEAGFYFEVLLEDGRFEEEHIYDYQDGMEVIGNEFDNKELLESEDRDESSN